ncbi:MAG: 6-phosphofructokinase, partial [Oscillospiraceae bacterium]|nr:6-phosphofructokinase [Oscillospiraceae bacterium]
MTSKLKTIGVLTSGGDSPGMNAGIRAVVRTAIANNVKVIGIREGYTGLINGYFEEMTLRSVSNILQLGGTKLLAGRSKEFMTEEGISKAVENINKWGLDALVVLGGDGSLKGALELTKRGINCIGIPCTIDNDFGSSEYTIGFDTASNTAMELVDKLRDTAQSHHKCNLVEVMGRDSGEIALHSGIACGATSIIIKEKGFDLQHDIIDRINKFFKTGKHHFIIVIAEGITNVHELATQIEKETGIGTRATVLGHVQRGGSPTAKDRVMASYMGYKAVDILLNGGENRAVVVKCGKVTDIPL